MFTPTRTPTRRGFTLIEVLVVIAIIGVLLALMLPALGAAKRRGLKTREMNDLKHMGHAWMMYANSNGDAALPGFLESPVQAEQVMGFSRGWDVSYKHPDGEYIPVTSENLTGPWTWRLLSYLSWNHPLVHSHLEEDNPDILSLVTEGKSVAYEPAFGYNGYYVGGWWAMKKINGVDTPFQRFHDHCSVDAHKRALSIPTSVSQIKRASDTVIFCSSSRFASPGEYHRLPSNRAGFHLVMPPMMALSQRWRPSASNPSGAMEIVEPDTCAPIGRYTGSIAVLRADGHVDQQGYDALNDARQWITSASAATFKHAACEPGP